MANGDDKPELVFDDKPAQAAPPQGEAAPELDFSQAQEFSKAAAPAKQEEAPELDFSQARELPKPTAPPGKTDYKGKPTMRMTVMLPPVLGGGTTNFDTGLHFDPTNKQDWHDMLMGTEGQRTTAGAVKDRMVRGYGSLKELAVGDHVAGALGLADLAVTGEKGIAGSITDSVAKRVGNLQAYAPGVREMLTGDFKKGFKDLVKTGVDRNKPEVKSIIYLAKAANDVKNGDMKSAAENFMKSKTSSFEHAVTKETPLEKEIQKYNPEFRGGAPDPTAVRPAAQPPVNIGQFIDVNEHPIGKALTENAEGLLSPESVAILAAGGMFGGGGKSLQAAQKLIDAGFGAQALASAYEHSQAAKEAWDEGDYNKFAYQLTHATVGGAMAVPAFSAAGGHPMPFLADRDVEAGKKIGDIAGKVGDPVYDAASKAVERAGGKISEAMGNAPTVGKAVDRLMTQIPKKGRAALRERIDKVQNDLTAIFNKDIHNKIVDPGTAADAIDQHLNSSIDSPLQAQAGATKDSAEPVVANFRDRLTERLDKFFKDNPGFGIEASDAAKKRILDRVQMQHDLGNGSKAARDPNLYESEDLRQHLNKEGNWAFGEDRSNADTNAYKAASKETANFFREAIDESYNNKGVTGVKEARNKEAALIDVRDGMKSLQSFMDSHQSTVLADALGSLFKRGKLYGALGAMALHGNVYGLAGLAAGALYDHIKTNLTDPFKNLQRAKELAQKSPTAQAEAPKFGGPEMQGPQPAPPGFEPPQGPQEPPVGPSAPPAEFPPPPKPPEPAQAPAVNHKLNGTLSTFFREWVGDVPYDQLVNRFEDYYAKIKTFTENANNKDYQGPKYTPEQIQQADRIQMKMNEARAADHAYVEKTNTANAAKHAKEMEKYNAKLKAEQNKVAAQAKEAAVQQKSVVEQKKKEDMANLLADERISHSVMKSTDAQANLGETETHSSDMIHGHEHGHIMAYAAEGLQPLELLSGEHPDAQEQNAMASLRVDHSDMEEGPKGLAQRVVGLLGGAAFDELHQDLSLGRNTGARGDIRKARALLRDEGGLTVDEVNKVFDALYDRAKQHVQNPEALAIVNANKLLRESGLHKNWLMSPGRMENYVKLLQGTYHGETPRTSGGTNEGAASGRDEGASDSGRKGSKSDGASKGVPSKEVRKTDQGGKGRRTADDARGRDELANFQIPPERSTGTPETDAAIKEGGAIPGGLQKGDPDIGLKDLVLFHDPKTGTTLAYYADSVTPEKVRAEIAKSRKLYGIKEEDDHTKNHVGEQ